MQPLSPWFRLGYIIPHAYTDMDAYQFARVAPDGVMLVTTQLALPEYGAIERELATLLARADVLAAQGADVISLSGVPVGALLGRSRVLALLDEIGARTGTPTDTDVEAHIAALRGFGASRIALVTWWSEEVTEALVRYLADADIDVVARSRGTRVVDPMQAHQLAMDLGREALADAPAAQALMIPGGRWFAVNAVPQIEERFDVPVTLNITATLWSALQGHRGVRRRHGDPAWGRLVGSL